MRLAFLVAAALVASGCSAGDDRLSREEFVQRADEICRKNRADVESQPSSFARFPHYASRVGPLVRRTSPRSAS